MTPATCSPLLRTGSVVKHAPQRLIVEISAQESCKQCAQGRGCGLGLLSPRRSQQVALELPGRTEAIEQAYPLGSLVTISLPSASVTLLAFFVYGLPLLLALLLSGLVSGVNTVIWLAPAVFFIALVGGVISVKYLLRGRRERFRPRLVS
ncbi:SoxR reducing system RseC family protein [Vreelandella neptunia]|uniref:SoxR reducing system RseC family protein n=1 Tax=Vreelandella neptunia TaxID=115551 RepID=A0ABS9S2G3_9GAMM|nr:SoxR reducing system RseC family protein [Halomonas neptunia]MCH4810301.1 SoxR reducing system RseC family protein [Halomonas neptunia]